MGMIIIDKQEGESMVQLLDRVRIEHGFSSEEKMTFAGRLDPLASGQCVVLVGQECKEKENYTKLSKEYKVTFLEGFETDTLDPLGFITDVSKIDSQNLKTITQEILETILLGTHNLPYPMYSSKTVNGKPLWLHAREGFDVEAPMRDMDIKRITLVSEEFCESQNVTTEMIARINNVKGNFRQKEIIEKYNEFFDHKKNKLRRITVRIECGPGSYMRSLTQLLSGYTQTPWIAERIHRTQIFL